MDLNQFGSIASIISLIIGLFFGAGMMHLYHVKIKISFIKKNVFKSFVNTGDVDQKIDK